MTEATLTQIVRTLRRGQVTIPTEFRRRLGIGDDSLLRLTLRRGVIEIEPVVALPAARNEWARELYRLFGDVRREATELSEAEIDARIDEAVAEVRAAQR